jgi:hypothetical protein
MGRVQRREFCYMGWEFVSVQSSQDGSAVDIKDLQRVEISFHHIRGFYASLLPEQAPNRHRQQVACHLNEYLHSSPCP